jgi:hypothetical protein
MLLITLSISDSLGQEMFGISNSNFAGNMGMALNPSLFVGSPYHHEFNAISGDFFFDNDYFYIERNSRFLRKSVFGESIDKERYKDYYDGESKTAYGSAFIRGPSYIENKSNFSWGVHTAIRSVIGANDIPVDIAKFIKEGLNYEPQQSINYSSGDYHSNSIFWGELGGTYGRVLLEQRSEGQYNQLTAAATLKFLIGFQNVMLDVQRFDYSVPSSDVLVVNQFNGTYGHSLDDGSDNGKDLQKPFKFRGYGGGVDLGLTYYRAKVHGGGDCNETAEIRKKYNYRLGFSLIDFGMVSFTKETKQYSFNGESAVFQGLDTIKFNTVYALDSTISSEFYGNPAASVSGTKYKMFLPSALSVQFDYCIRPSIYANLTLVQPIPIGEYKPIRPSQSSLSVRYETRKFEVSVPLTFYQYKYPHFGLAVRYGVLVIGTDRLGSYTGLWDVTGYDLFFGLKWNVCDPDAKKKTDPYCP